MSLFAPINEVIDMALLGNHDIQKADKGRLLSWAKWVFRDMNLDVVKATRREIFEINKRTNSVDMPPNTLKLASVSVVDRHGHFYPVYRSERVHSDIVDIPAEKNCGCEHQCGNRLCATVKSYEAVTSIKSDFLPDGTPISFSCVDRKAVDRGGMFYEEIQYPLRVYVSNIWTQTILHTEKRSLCQVEVDKNGCICDTVENVVNVCKACGIDTTDIPHGGTALKAPCNTDKWVYYCNRKMDFLAAQCGEYPVGGNFNNVYNISEDGDRLIFPANFGFSRVLIRRYVDASLVGMQVPVMAVPTFVTGLKWFDARWDDKKVKIGMDVQYGRMYAQQKTGLFNELNKYRIAELAQIIAPKILYPEQIINEVYPLNTHLQNPPTPWNRHWGIGKDENFLK